jgi:hypothetical protein
MSADNWAICPRCLKRARAAHDVAVEAVKQSYGNVSIEEFDAARAAILDVDPESLRTFREDYEFYGAESGKVVASYSGNCDNCDLSLNFEEERELDV